MNRKIRNLAGSEDEDEKLLKDDGKKIKSGFRRIEEIEDPIGRLEAPHLVRYREHHAQEYSRVIDDWATFGIQLIHISRA